MNTGEIKPKYSSIDIFVTEELKSDFLLECKLAGVNAGEPICLSVNSQSRIAVFYETLSKNELIISLLKVMKNMLRKDQQLKIEISDSKKIIELKGYSEEEACRLLEASEAIQLSHREKNQDDH